MDECNRTDDGVTSRIGSADGRDMTSWTDYAVEIRIPLGKEYRVGSGYLIGPGLILTALHVVVGSLENCSEIVAPSPILIRAYGDFHAAFGELLGWNSRDLLNKMAVAAPDGDFRWRTATLVWPANNTSPPRFDAALLEVAPSDRLPHVAAPRSITCLDPIGRVSCEGMGFPIWGWTKTEEGKSLSSPITVSADLSDGAQGSDGMRALTVLRSSTPRQESDWEGLSGTAFLDDASHELLGIVSRTQDSSRNDALRLALLSDFWGPDMAGFWKRSRLPRPTASRFGIVALLPPRPKRRDLVSGGTAFSRFAAHQIRGPRFRHRLLAEMAGRKLTGRPASERLGSPSK